MTFAHTALKSLPVLHFLRQSCRVVFFSCPPLCYSLWLGGTTDLSPMFRYLLAKQPCNKTLYGNWFSQIEYFLSCTCISLPFVDGSSKILSPGMNQSVSVIVLLWISPRLFFSPIPYNYTNLYFSLSLSLSLLLYHFQLCSVRTLDHSPMASGRPPMLSLAPFLSTRVAHCSDWSALTSSTARQTWCGTEQNLFVKVSAKSFTATWFNIEVSRPKSKHIPAVKKKSREDGGGGGVVFLSSQKKN